MTKVTQLIDTKTTRKSCKSQDNLKPTAREAMVKDLLFATKIGYFS